MSQLTLDLPAEHLGKWAEAHSVRCPSCAALIGEPCTWADRSITRPHLLRITAAATEPQAWRRRRRAPRPQ